ncbi:MAG TPA: CBS domain-containing protein [Thermodesulfobacteriota bacterium]|nr:CBS domain-containing protein [Thermodesulfobacteriota bacterium]
MVKTSKTTRKTSRPAQKKPAKPKAKKAAKLYNPDEPVKIYMSRNPVSIPSDTGVKTAFKLLQAKGFKQLLVVDNGKLTGVVTDRDFRKPQSGVPIEAWQEHYKISDLHKIRDIKTSNVTTIDANAPLIDAVQIFEKKKFNALPVLSNGDKLVGILTVHDILSSLIRSYRSKKR